MLLHLQNINKTYREKGYKVQALKNINLDVEEGEMLAIMGVSGSGKSTLLDIIGCVNKTDAGIYELNGKQISNYSEKEMAKLRNQMFGFVLQDFALIERYSVAQNVMLPLYYTKMSKKERMKKVERILNEVALLDKKEQLVMHLSGGQRQRVAIARALVNDASIILADEPTGALDQKTGEDIVNIFTRLNKEGKTVIIVTHDPKVAAACNRTIKIVDGEISIK